MKNWPKTLSLLDRSLWSLKNLIFIGKIQQGGAYEDRGSKCSPNFLNKAAETRLWPRSVARWPHPGGTAPGFMF